jgi:hypothetical protein
MHFQVSLHAAAAAADGIPHFCAGHLLSSSMVGALQVPVRGAAHPDVPCAASSLDAVRACNLHRSQSTLPSQISRKQQATVCRIASL